MFDITVIFLPYMESTSYVIVQLIGNSTKEGVEGRGENDYS